MPSKRSQPALGFERRVRARREDDWEPESDVEGESSDEGASEMSVDGSDSDDAPSASEDQSDTGSESDESDTHDEPAPKIDLSAVSFGALARAQASLPPSGRRAQKTHQDTSTAPEKSERREKSGGGGGKKTEPRPKRSSKHAPQGVDEAKAQRAYAFLDEYRDSEMAELRAQIKKAKDPAAKEQLKRRLMSMESRRLARQRREDGERLVREHRRQEKELVAQGKKPFYLKKSAQKERLLTQRFEGMSKGQVDKAIQRKRKKVAGKEKKELDFLTRPRDRH
ncbi:hypothetical protein HIM_05039 [Hirsutella minnesotensis 3608]|uniref:rRNA biogenesis protein RRP36 n=1 Tax=Hirsutella minnesotensis 3608 TaxID=1043627 RepID=A0A0F7ZKS2_9HYPO|nr:hypothetical protein HIM_05039 [Hirsutella minnesotensis 3608]